MRTYESHNSEFANWSFSVTAPKFQPLKKKNKLTTPKLEEISRENQTMRSSHLSAAPLFNSFMRFSTEAQAALMSIFF